MYIGLKDRLYRLLRWSERYTKTDMVYLAESGFWIQANSVFIALASFALYIVFARVVPKEVYGSYQYLLSIGAILTSLTLTGMSIAVVRAVARGFEGTFRESIRVQLAWSIVPFFVACLAAAYYFIQGNMVLALGLALIGIFVPINTTFNTYSAYLTAKRDFQRGFFYSLFINTPYYLAVIAAAFSMPTALALLSANLISQAIGYLIAHRRTLAVYKPNVQCDPEAIRNGKHFTLMNVLSTVATQIDNVLVFHFFGAAQLALYSFVTAVPDRLDISKNLSSAALSKFANRTYAELRASMARKVLLSTGGAFLIAIAWSLLAYPFFSLFFPNYLSAVPYSQLYAFIIPTTFGSLFTTVFTAHGHIKTHYVYKAVTPIFQLCILFAGVLYAGLWGLIVARILGSLSASLFALFLFLRLPYASPSPTSTT